jgi:hypothetical protein
MAQRLISPPAPPSCPQARQGKWAKNETKTHFQYYLYVVVISQEAMQTILEFRGTTILYSTSRCSGP